MNQVFTLWVAHIDSANTTLSVMIAAVLCGIVNAVDELRREAERGLELTNRSSGRPRTPGETMEVLTRVSTEMAKLGGKRVSKVATRIKGRSAHELLTGVKAEDRLSMLGFALRETSEGLAAAA